MGSIKAGEREKDESAMSRLRFWQAGLQMAVDNPLGVGPGNFHTHIGNYLPQDAGRDTHNTYVRCVAELGWPGLALLLGLIANAFIILARVRSSATDFPGSSDCAWYAYSLQIGLSAYLVAALFISATYIEMLWRMLLLPARAGAGRRKCPRGEDGLEALGPGPLSFSILQGNCLAHRLHPSHPGRRRGRRSYPRDGGGLPQRWPRGGRRLFAWLRPLREGQGSPVRSGPGDDPCRGEDHGPRPGSRRSTA